MSSKRAAVLIAALITVSGRDLEAQTAEAGGSSCPAEWAAASFELRRGLPFDPLTFEAPSLRLQLMRVRDRRWWAEAVVNAIVAAGLLAADRAAPATDLAESLMRRPELSFGLPFGPAGPQDDWQVRLQVKVKRGAPHVGVVVTW